MADGLDAEIQGPGGLGSGGLDSGGLGSGGFASRRLDSGGLDAGGRGVARILVVDDEPDIRDLIALNLASVGHLVEKTASGDEVVAMCRAQRPDAIVLDVMLPGTDGFAVLRSLKSDPDLATIPVVMVTAVAVDESRIRGGIEGALGYVTKPFTRRALLDALELVLTLGSRSEPEARRAARDAAIAELVGLEGGDSRRSVALATPNVRMEPRPAASRAQMSSRVLQRVRHAVGNLEPDHRVALHALRDAGSATRAANQLGQTRTRYYATLRRIAQQLGVDGTPGLQAAIDAGALDD